MPRLSLDRQQVFAALRISVGVALLYYALIEVVPQFELLYGVDGMVRPALFGVYIKSPLFYIWGSPALLRLSYALVIGGLVMFTVGLWARWAQLLALPVWVAFHHANPFLIHEPQQLTNLLFVATLFIPFEGAWVVRPSPRLADWGRGGAEYERRVLTLLLAYLGAYYFFAGAKKLPDPMWSSGDALGLLVHWSGLRVDGFLAELMRAHSLLPRLGTWLALVFEMSFVLVAFSRFRIWLLPIGIAFHLTISQTLDVGHFWIAMPAWYPLLLTRLEDTWTPAWLRRRVGS